MALFGRNKKKDGCCCGGNCNEESMAVAEKSKVTGAKVKILGAGCSKCNELEVHTTEAMKQLGMQPDIEHITDFVQIASYGVMTTPALVIDGKVVSLGKVLSVEEIKELL